MSPRIEVLGSNDAPALRALLAREPASNLYLLGVLEEFGIGPGTPAAPFAFHGAKHAGQLTAAIFVGGNGGLVIPSCGDERDLTAIADHLAHTVQLRSAIGERNAVDVLCRHLGAARPRLSRAQRLFAVSADDLGPFTNPTLRLAADADLEQLVQLSAAAIRELMTHDPIQQDAAGFRLRVHQRIRARRTYVYEERGRIVFKLDIGSRSQFGAELEGLYTVPDERRRGHATLSLGQISRHLLSSLPRLTLRIDDADGSLAHVARKVGYVPGKAQRLVIGE